jgi:hypothetical protein
LEIGARIVDLQGRRLIGNPSHGGELLLDLLSR